MVDFQNLMISLRSWSKNLLANLKILISAGPTHEAIDPVRFIGNRSSGKMGYALARAFAKLNHEVRLISGPVQISLNHPQVHITPVQSAADMYGAVTTHATSYDIAVMAAAVADFTPLNIADQKIKKEIGQDQMTIVLKKTQDILASLGEMKKTAQTLVGFSLETNNEEHNALGKLKRKRADLIVLNSLNDSGAGFGYDTNKVTVFGENGLKQGFPLLSKQELAGQLVDLILYYHGNKGNK